MKTLFNSGLVSTSRCCWNWHQSWQLRSQIKVPLRSLAAFSTTTTNQFPKETSNSNRTDYQSQNLQMYYNKKDDKTNAQINSKNKSFKIFNQDLPTSSLSLARVDERSRSLERPEQIIPSVSQLMAEDETLQNPDYFQVFNLFTVKDLFDARVHLGHKVGSMNSLMRPFIFGSRFDHVVFDLDLTAFHLRQALNFVAHVAYRSGVILFITRSPQTMHLVEKTAVECGEYAHTKNWETSILADSKNKFGGITRLPDLVILLCTLDTVLAPHGAVKDAAKMLIPTIGVVDSNCNPNLVTFPIPGNDDTPSSVEFYCKLFKEAISRGKNKRKLVDMQQRQSSSNQSDENVKV